MADINASLLKALDGSAPQYKRAGQQAFDPVEGSDGALHTKILDQNGNPISSDNPLSVSLDNNSIQVMSESGVELKAGESFVTTFRRARGNKMQLTVSTESINVSDTLRVTIYHFNDTKQGSVFSEVLEMTHGTPGYAGRLWESELYAKYYQINITNTTNEDTNIRRLYLKETVGTVREKKKSVSTIGSKQVIERGRKVYDHNAISLADRDVIFETTEPFILDRLFYIYKPDNPDYRGTFTSHAPVIFLRTGNTWDAYTGVATYGTGSTAGRINPYPEAIAGHINNSHFPHYNILQYSVKDGVYSFEINQKIEAPEGFQFAVYLPNAQEEGHTSEFTYHLIGRVL